MKPTRKVSRYSVQKKCKERIDKLGITRDNAREISKYAADMYLDERYDEVEAEFMSLRRRT